MANEGNGPDLPLLDEKKGETWGRVSPFRFNRALLKQVVCGGYKRYGLTTIRAASEPCLSNAATPTQRYATD